MSDLPVNINAGGTFRTIKCITRNMKAVINIETGVLEITPENKAEKYLLNGWHLENQKQLLGHFVQIVPEKK